MKNPTDYLIKQAIEHGIPENYAKANPSDAWMRVLLGKQPPKRNDCGYASRFELEDNARLGGWIAPEGSGLCDYPQGCPLYQKNECPLN